VHQQFAAELAATNQRLEVQNRELERANRLKSEFLASMSHELRTPLHTIIGFADLLSEELKGPLNPDQKRFVTHIQTDSRHLLELINDILDLSRIEAGRLDLHPELFAPADAITQTIAGLRPAANNKSITIIEDLDRTLRITADPVRFKEIISNLVSNAIKFTPEGGRITVECRGAGHGAAFSVTDTGIGIPAAEQQAIFDKFYQLGSTTRGVREGTGLGLAITRSLVEMHGGSISVESEPGAGSRFEFFLPHAHDIGPTEHASAREKDALAVLFVAKPSESRDRITTFLESRGYALFHAQRLQHVFPLAHQKQVSAVLLDLAGLGTDASDAMQHLRSHPATQFVPIVAFLPAGTDITAVSLGANEVVRKPIDPESLVKILERLSPRVPGELPRILVVDDEPEARELMDEVLRSAGLLPVMASSGKQALEVLASSPIGAVVIDLMMPEMNGFELILRIRLDPKLSDLPLVVLTAKELDSLDMEILSRHTNAVFLKASPWKQDFLARLEQILHNLKKE
jgi:CheY-like chemotaxis protein/nitrogen-specific signal transduction histidine kinase